MATVCHGQRAPGQSLHWVGSSDRTSLGSQPFCSCPCFILPDRGHESLTRCWIPQSFCSFESPQPLSRLLAEKRARNVPQDFYSLSTRMQRDGGEGSGLQMMHSVGSFPGTAPRDPFLPVMLLLHHTPHPPSGSGNVLQPGSSWHLPWHQLVQAQHFLSPFFHSKLHHYCGMEKADILCGV